MNVTSYNAWAALALLVAGCGDAGAGSAQAKRGARMDAATISACHAESATLNLVPEALMTRAALTEETLAQRYPATAIQPGDPRLARLTAALRDLKVEPASQPRFDPRLLVRVRCEGGKTITILGSATAPDGRIHLSIDGQVVSSKTAFRKEVEALAQH
jgi:hypothetical protein